MPAQVLSIKKINKISQELTRCPPTIQELTRAYLTQQIRNEWKAHSQKELSGLILAQVSFAPLLAECNDLAGAVRDSAIAFEVYIHLTRLLEIYLLAHVCLACHHSQITLDELLRWGDRFSYVTSEKTDEQISFVQRRMRFESANAQLIGTVINTKSVVECDYVSRESSEHLTEA